jgi:hypothetical protein
MGKKTVNIQEKQTEGKKNIVRVIALVVLFLCGAAFLVMVLLPRILGKQTGLQGVPVLPAGSAPAVVSAVIMPENPATATQLSVHYTGQGQEGAMLSYRFRWYVNGNLVQDNNSPILDPGCFKKSDHVRLDVIPSDASQIGKPYQCAEVVIGNRPPLVRSITLVPVNAPVNTVVTAEVVGEDPDGDAVSYTYQWGVNGKYVTDPGKEKTFRTTGLHKKDRLYVTVTPSDGDSIGEPRASDISILSNSAPVITSTPNYAVSDNIYTYQVSANDPDGDPLTYDLVKSPPGMTIDHATGLIRWEVPRTVTGKQEFFVKISVDDGDGGNVSQEYSLFIEMK